MKAKDCLEELEAAKSFIIFNVDVGKVIDFDKKYKTLNSMWHLTNELNQLFRWKPVPSYQANGGMIESCLNPNTFISIQNEKTFVLTEKQDQATLFLVEFDQRGFARISTWIYGQYNIIESNPSNDSKKQYRTITLRNLTSDSPYSWAFLTVDQGTFNNERILIRTATTGSDEMNSKGLNTQTGSRFIMQEEFDIYNKQKYLILAKFAKDKNLYSFKQINGEGYMTVQQNAVTLLPYQEKKSDWVIIQNIISKVWHFISQESFLYLSSKQVSMNVDEPKIGTNLQSFQIQRDNASEQKTTQNNYNIQESTSQNVTSVACYLKCKGSGKYLVVLKGSIEEKIDESIPQSVFSIVTEPFKPDSMRIFFEDSPVGATKPMQTSAVQILDKLKANSKETYFFYDKKTQILYQDTRMLSVVGGKLFAVNSDEQPKQINPYAQFDIELISKADYTQQQKMNIPQQLQEQQKPVEQYKYPNLIKDQETAFHLKVGGILLTIDELGYLKQITDPKQKPSEFTLQQVGQNKVKILFLEYPLSKTASTGLKWRNVAVYQQTKYGAEILSFSYDSKRCILLEDNHLFLLNQFVFWSDMAKEGITVSLEPLNK